jgi:serine/threonine-protein kinase HipA
MNRCPILYIPCKGRYSAEGLRKLSPRLHALHDFPYSAEQQIREAAARADKISIQGVQPKLSARLNVAAGSFELVDNGGVYILKPQHPQYPQLPENEDLTMHLARLAGIETPLHGLVYCADGSRTYWIRRFDRAGRGNKLAVEDFAQLAGKERETKYDSSMEQIVELLQLCTFPAVERANLFRRSLFCFLVGNEDMHLKNFSVIRRDGIVGLAPAYDYLNTTLAFQALGRPLSSIEEVALPLGGRKRKLTKEQWLEYYALDRLDLKQAVIADILAAFAKAVPSWHEWISNSFLAPEHKKLYADLLKERCHRLGLL